MIALNEYIENEGIFKEFYKLKNLNFNFEKLNSLILEFKQTTKEAEQMRSNCNKLCGEITSFVNDKNVLKQKVAYILKIDKLANKNQAKAKRQLKKINSKLSKLANVPAKLTKENKTLASEDSVTTANNFAEQTFVSNSNENINSFFKHNKNVVLDENQLPMSFKQNNVINILQSNYQDYLSVISQISKNAKTTMQISSLNLSFDASEKYIFEFQNETKLELTYLGQYYTRKFNLKYKDKNDDVTKFPIQIELKII